MAAASGAAVVETAGNLMRRALVMAAVCIGLVGSLLFLEDHGPAAADGPLVGPVEGIDAACRLGLSDSTVGGDTIAVGASARVVLRCYVSPSVMAAAEIGNNFLGFRWTRHDGYFMRPMFDMDDVMMWDVENGRAAFSFSLASGTTGIRAYSSWALRDSTNTALDTGEWLGDKTIVSSSTGSVDPGWPEYWPAPSTAVPPPRTVDVPAVRCWVDLWRNQAGELRGDFHAETSGRTPPGATDHWEWAFEWDDWPVAERVPPTDDAFWSDAPFVLDGQSQLGYPVSEGGSSPGGGWWVGVRLRRVYAETVHTYHSEQVPIATDPVDVSVGVVPFLGWMPWMGEVGGEGLYVFEGYESVTVEGSHVAAYEAVSVACPLLVDPERAGHPSGDVVSVVAPPAGMGGEQNPPSDDEGGGGSPGCDVPSGWGRANPLEWGGWLFCSLIEGIPELLRALLRAIGDLATGIAGLASAIVSGISDLFIPSSLDFGWTAIRDDAEGRAPFVYASAARQSAQDLVAGLDGGSGTCPRIRILEHGVSECIEGPGSGMPGVSLVRGLFIVLLWIGVAWRIVRTAPWARGRDAGEPGG